MRYKMLETAIMDKVLINFTAPDEAIAALIAHPDLVEMAMPLANSYLYAQRSALPLLRTEFGRFTELTKQQETYLLEGEL